MSLKEQLQADLVSAMRAGDAHTRDVLRGVMAAIKQIEVDERTDLDDERVMAVLVEQVKQRRETIADAKKADRDDLIGVAQGEIAVLDAYLPRQLDREELEPIVAGIVAELGVSDMKGMGRVMSQAIARLGHQADRKLLSQIVREQLQ
jgi:uncharacterized protein YqeY